MYGSELARHPQLLYRMARLLNAGAFLPAFPKPANLQKRYVVANVQMNSLSFLFVGQKAEMFVLRGKASRLISPGLKIAA
jgi:hypothetical protein